MASEMLRGRCKGELWPRVKCSDPLIAELSLLCIPIVTCGWRRGNCAKISRLSAKIADIESGSNTLAADRENAAGSKREVVADKSREEVQRRSFCNSTRLQALIGIE